MQEIAQTPVTFTQDGTPSAWSVFKPVAGGYNYDCPTRYIVCSSFTVRVGSVEYRLDEDVCLD